MPLVDVACVSDKYNRQDLLGTRSVSCVFLADVCCVIQGVLRFLGRFLLCFGVTMVQDMYADFVGENVPIDRRVCLYVLVCTCVYDVCAVTRQAL